MGISTIDTSMLRNAFLAGAKGLEAEKDWINELNVFPVSDEDAGTNMTLTIMAAAKEVAELGNPTMDRLAEAISSGFLRGARRNSGVISSQLLKGFTKGIEAVEEIDTIILANAMVRGTEITHRAIMKPKEGTILTVVKAMADRGLEVVLQTDDIEESVKQVIEYDGYVLSRTPEMLPVLKQAGVVDSGGQGLMQVVKGAVDGLPGRAVDFSLDTISDSGNRPAAGEKAARGATRTDINTADIKFGCCTEFIIGLEKVYMDKDEMELKSYLESIGDSLMVVSDDEIVKVHVHANHPSLASEEVLTYGSLSRVKIDNMRKGHQERVIQDSERPTRERATRKQEDKDKATGEEAPSERREYDFIIVSNEEGLSDIFRGIGADCLIEGGQAMNPSTEDMLKAIKRVSAENIFILPNNKDIIMAAQQARDLAEDKNIIVVPSRTVLQGITALVNFMPNLGPKENARTMTEEMGNVRTAQITYAVRTANTDGTDIKERDTMALGDRGVLTVGKPVDGVALEVTKEMLDDESELATIYHGVNMSEHETKILEGRTQEQCPDKEIGLQYGRQPIHYYLISAE